MEQKFKVTYTTRKYTTTDPRGSVHSNIKEVYVHAPYRDDVGCIMMEAYGTDIEVQEVVPVHTAY